MAEETKMIEAQPRVETPRLSPFEKMQGFLKEHGEIDPNTRELRFERPAYSLTHLALLPIGIDTERVRRFFDLSITQSTSTGDIEIKLTDTTKEAKPKSSGTEITLTNPLNEKEEKAIIRPFDHVGNVLRLSRNRWKEFRDTTGKFYTTDSDEEVEKIVTDFTEMGIGKRKMVGRFSQEPKVSRRGFLKLFGHGVKLAALDSILAHVPGAPSLSKSFWEQLETATLGVSPETLKKEIEERFQVEVVGPSTGMIEVTYSGNQNYPTVEWDGPSLKGLIGALAELPPYFYQPRRIGEKESRLRFALTDISLAQDIMSGFSRKWGAYCACHAAENQLIVLNKLHIGQTLPQADESRDTFVHELTHAVTTPEIKKYVDNITAPIGLDTLPELRKTFSSIIIMTSKGKPHGVSPKNAAGIIQYSAPSYDLKIVIVDKDSFISDRSVLYEVNKEGDNFYFKYYKDGKQIGTERLIKVNPKWYVKEGEFNRFGEEFFKGQYNDYLTRTEDWEKYGGDIASLSGVPGVNTAYLSYGATNFQEFFSVAATFYIGGQDRFVGTYEPFLGKERSEKLYAGMKREIFRGKEY